ncbi:MULTISPECIES: DUF4376 domain-containing protein [Burkholderia]|jgi:hypothetical protein|uniref:DUF4376 domain-containing protein n=1 Tax=Burkholderia TaxID=32008 RepID=UPI000DAEC0EF|nr:MULTISPECIES: DUF4376 domain-containing protein [Burkholderia]MDP9548454.1 hypothetical protein [Burkholderia cepacia]MBR8392531.1 DUF4376 domain-containing protein [Burkholderia cenocepacia]MBR8469372.1 DUF4376 domain-containing protein [Burkholderia cenocepacia]MBR8488623.1 DUF4376 domain-containing protein [Burkholderia cenocepacia]MDN7619891.1 DUF4376 domain-containing protein [Burkholderia cenocepacia]
MSIYAWIQNGKVAEIIEPMLDDSGMEIPISTRFPAQLVAEFVDVTNVPGATVGWTCTNGIVSAPAGPTLAQAQAAQNALIDSEYQSAITEPVLYKTAGGMTKTFQADDGSQKILMQTTQGYAITGSVPAAFYWVSSDNTQVPFTLADLQGLYQAMLDQGWAAFQHKQALKAQIGMATTVAAVQAVTW